ncbi:uncharacterized protein LOC128385544 [Panonychus citri]|uniref:uncharacterized protein LOC128385544 n=1 Tax=Panonychus citri TaxID=50023 RepID=UPI002306FDF6|nr:uncharacterized protein LOC128385544 [Panonychus citri]
MIKQLTTISLILFVSFIILISVDVTISSPVYNYNVTIKTSGSPKFESHQGKLKMNILYQSESGTSQEDFVLTPVDVKIEPNREYQSTIASFSPMANITSIYLRWTLASPYNPIYKIKKPVVYFDSITLTHINSDSAIHMTITQSRRYCSPVSPTAIKHADGNTFYPCV